MARYWVGVDQNWHDLNNWSLTSGGVGGAGIPTSIDDVIFDGNGNSMCWPTADIECNNFTIEATGSSKFILIDTCDATIHGDFIQHEAYFGATGGGGMIIEFKGNWLYDGGSFSIGTGMGVDPTCLYSGIGKTYSNMNLAAATFQNFSVSGTLTMSGQRLGQANVSLKVSVTGVLTINKYGSKVCDFDLSGINAGFDVFTGEITGTGRFWYRYKDSSSMPTGGTISVAYWRFILQDSLAVLNPRTYEEDCEVEVAYDSTGQTFRLEGGAVHYFLGKVTILGDDSAILSAEFDCATNDAQMWVEGNFTVKSNAFPQATFTIKFGNGIHVFRGSISFYFSYGSPNCHLVVDAGEGTIILTPKPATGGGIIIFLRYRLSRVYSGGQEFQNYNRVIIFNAYPDTRGGQFIEGFEAKEFIAESYRATWNFRRDNAVPLMLLDFDRFRVIGSEMYWPQLRSQRSLTPGPFGLKVNEEDDIFSCQIRDCNASWGNEIEAYNSQILGSLGSNIEFYDRDVRSVNRQRNILGARARLNPTPAPEGLTEQLMETM